MSNKLFVISLLQYAPNIKNPKIPIDKSVTNVIEYVVDKVPVNLCGCLMSDFKFGNMAWPPKGAIRIPIANKRSGIDCGHILVGIIEINEPGESGFKNPHTNTNNVIEIVDIIPNNEKMDNIGNGKNVNGVKTKKLINLNFVLVQTTSSPNNA